MNPGPGRLVLFLLVIVFDLCQEDPLNSFSSFPSLRFSSSSRWPGSTEKCNKNSPARLKSDVYTLRQFASMQDVSWQPRPQGAFLWLFFWHIYNRFQSWIAFKSQYPHTNSPVLDCKQSLFFFRFSEGSARERNEGSRPLVVYSRLVSIHFLKK